MGTRIWIILTLNLIITLISFGQEKVTTNSLVGKQAPEWSLKDKDGKTYCFSDYKGKLVLIEFLATKCGACKRAIDDVNEINSKYKLKNFAVIGILDKKAEFKGYDLAKGFDLNTMNYLTLENGEKYWGDYKIAAVPTFYLINKDGKIIYSHSGTFNDELKKELTDLIEKSL